MLTTSEFQKERAMQWLHTLYLSGRHKFTVSSALTLLLIGGSIPHRLPMPKALGFLVAAIRLVQGSSCTGKLNTEAGEVNDIYHDYLSH